ncbi:MAG: MerR family transcriptional regulator [Acidimicrobiales bacterium]
MADRAHLSIGEVLSLLQDAFPDITISKIRFLESQGLLDPERTPSGYRKFYEADIERLRWILRQQKDNFLPLRVIKDRLEEIGPSGAPPDDIVRAPEPEVGARRRAAAVTAVGSPGATLPSAGRPSATLPSAGRTPSALPSAPSIFEQLQGALEVPVPAAAAATPTSTAPSGETHLDAGPTGASFTTDELAAAAGCSDKLLAELVRYGLIAGRPMGRDTIYDEDALVVSRLAATFGRFGVEARHLRMYKVAAEREAGFLEQVILPLMKQRNPASRRQAVENLDELCGLGNSLRGALLRHALKTYTS